MAVRLDLDLFLDQLNELTDIADDFSSAQADMQAVMSDHWTSLGELNRFEGPQDAVLADLATAFNELQRSFDHLAIDLRATFDAFVATDDVSAEDMRSITSELDDLDRAIEGIQDIVAPVRGTGHQYTIV